MFFLYTGSEQKKAVAFLWKTAFRVLEFSSCEITVNLLMSDVGMTLMKKQVLIPKMLPLESTFISISNRFVNVEEKRINLCDAYYFLKGRISLFWRKV